MTNLSWPQRTTLALGALLLLWSLADVAADREPLALLHSITGLAVLAAVSRVRTARFVGTLLGVVFLVVFAYAGGDPGGPLDAGALGNGVHLLIGFTSVAIALSCVWCEQRARASHRRRARRLP
ncbi:hypothetical protein [Saccharothrix algeriensis]|uniref:Nicotinamide riboside transporter PnuC n=1 Tax=Saccharothrix algeriensis TaxID=173560 RepID=A0A8T8HUX8_9PSEU|nr:hypothetical protein [Saccharothrix algeriensis]MBM7813879.1 nicotinamide riboside transporter PnuC [Saccharothrix algeriensis]QTR02312.1 hypothetical protein J7S33_24590 [Saccharothrix algeriensis]